MTWLTILLAWIVVSIVAAAVFSVLRRHGLIHWKVRR
jgi:NhaP-type Na+/H+ and K+/H+ antiporter